MPSSETESNLANIAVDFAPKEENEDLDYWGPYEEDERDLYANLNSHPRIAPLLFITSNLENADAQEWKFFRSFVSKCEAVNEWHLFGRRFQNFAIISFTPQDDFFTFVFPFITEKSPPGFVLQMHAIEHVKKRVAPRLTEIRKQFQKIAESIEGCVCVSACFCEEKFEDSDEMRTLLDQRVYERNTGCLTPIDECIIEQPSITGLTMKNAVCPNHGFILPGDKIVALYPEIKAERDKQIKQLHQKLMKIVNKYKDTELDYILLGLEKAGLTWNEIEAMREKYSASNEIFHYQVLYSWIMRSSAHSLEDVDNLLLTIQTM